VHESRKAPHRFHLRVLQALERALPGSRPECYVTCPGFIPLFSKATSTVCVEGLASSKPVTQCIARVLEELGVTILPVRRCATVRFTLARNAAVSRDSELITACAQSSALPFFTAL
jgi:hypothetical protein